MKRFHVLVAIVLVASLVPLTASAGDGPVPGATSPFDVQDGGSRIELQSILHITTTSTDQSIERALNELGYAYDYFYGVGWTGIDFGPYDMVIIGMDGGNPSDADVLKIRTDVVDAGKRVIWVGGTSLTSFCTSINSYLVPNDTNNCSWTVSGSPQFSVVQPGHPLANGLPVDPFDWANSSTGYYMLRATDPTLDVIAVNGDGYDDYFLKAGDWPVVEGAPDNGGDLIWLLNSARNDYWAIQSDFDVLKQIIGNAIGYEPVDAPDIRVEPGSLYAQQCPDEFFTQTLQICNDGSLPLEWSLTEVPAPKVGNVEIALPAGADSHTAPDGYVPALTRSESQGRYPEAGTVCVFKNVNAWDSTSVENILTANGIPYEVHTSAEFAGLDFGLYGMIVVSSDQDQTFYDDYAANAAKFEAYVSNGGFLAFFAADQGWNGGSLNAALPGGMTYSHYSETYNYIDDPAHPTMAGVPDPFWGSSASHGVFADLPVDAHVIAHGEWSGSPTTVEYPIGAGWFIGLAQTLEISYDWGWDGGPILPNTLLWGYNWGPGVDIPWLSEDPTAGTVDPGTCQDVAIQTDSTGLEPGDYFGDLDIQSNDPDEPQVMVPVQLTVLNCNLPDITVTPESLLAEQCPDTMTEQTLTICNEGLGDLDWSLSELVPPKGPQDVLYDNGPLVTHPGGGYGGADASVLQTNLGLNTYGFGHQYSYNYRVADDFVADGDWTVDQITFFAYQTNAPTDPSTFLGYNLAVWDGVPGAGGSIIWGNYVDNCMVDTGWMGAYRVTDYDMMGTARPIMANVCATPGLVLPPGQYWLDWQADGSLSSGPWAPPITILGETTTGDALQSLDGGASFAYLVDSGLGTAQGLPFIIEGTAGGEPGIPWLGEDPTSGTVPAGECQEVTVTFDSTGLAPGDYFGGLLIESNDPDEPEIVVPVQLTVEPCENTMHVADIQAYPWANPGGFPAWVMGVRVVDGDDMPLGEVFVEATVWIPGDMAARERYSLPNGWARFWAPAARTGNYQICVDNLTLAGYTYNPDDNVVTCMDWDL